jgi:hypothetical protein
MSEFEQLSSSLQPLRESIVNHRLYQRLHSLESLHVFMEHHVFAVWDFMSLLKSLQRSLSCVEVPWRPSPSPTGCRLVNEIVLSEESDSDGEGGYVSHFELYLSAMQQAGASTTSISTVINSLEVGASHGTALAAASVRPAICQFVDTTFRTIESGGLCAIASAFTFGREDLLPDVFEQIVSRLNSESSGRLGRFEYYLRRHIELDGGQHGAMAQRLMEELCGNEPDHWESARAAAKRSLEARRHLWDSLADYIDSQVSEPSLSGLS